MREALLYKKLDPSKGEASNKVQCNVCNHRCIISENKRGICGVRENQNGKLYSLVYGKIIAEHIDPIEKKPLYNFLPGTFSLSIATAGCNFKCLHCQNAEISQISKERPEDVEISGENKTPEQIIKDTLDNKCPSISYTYTEPTIFVEFALDCMKLAKERGLKNVWVSNGYMSKETLDLVGPYLDAINVDLKAFTEEFYQEVCGAKLQPVLDNLIDIKRRGIHLEITTLIIPGKNDSEKELKGIAEFIKKELGNDVPWHVSRFFPYYKMMDILPTPVEKILQAVEIGKKAGLRYVYAGNI
jgi:pyruvate formate lyase activating enzyme